MAQVDFVTIGGSDYGRCVYDDGTRRYAVVTKRRNASGFRIQRTLNSAPIKARIDAAIDTGNK